jgi:hypothetical protein
MTQRTIVSVSNPRWSNASQTMLDADVLFAELEALGPVPFTATDNADTPHGQEIWDNALAGEYGEIAEFVGDTIQYIINAPDQLVNGPTLKDLFGGNT